MAIQNTELILYLLAKLKLSQVHLQLGIMSNLLPCSMARVCLAEIQKTNHHDCQTLLLCHQTTECFTTTFSSFKKDMLPYHGRRCRRCHLERF